MRSRAFWALETSPAAAGPVAVVRLTGDVDGALERLGIAGVGMGEVRVRDLAGVDRGVVSRWTERTAHLMPHGGAAVVRSLVAALEGSGLERERRADPREAYPEAEDEVEAWMVAALARAASPLAMDLLLDQPRRWREAGGRSPSGGGGAAQGGEGSSPRGGGLDAPSRALGSTGGVRERVLGRLIDPPLVVAVGPPNVGKSTLLNALAGREVAVVADQPGTTRDHVGALLDLGGLVVRYVDTPGLREAGGVEGEARAVAAELLPRAELVVACGDHERPPPPSDWGGGTAGQVRVALRADLGEAAWPCDARVSAVRGEGVEALVRLIRDRLVPPEALADARPWRFWAGLGLSEEGRP